MQAKLTAANDNNNENQKQFPVASALREAGFIPLPRLWVKAEDIPSIHAIADRYGPEIHQIRAEVYEKNQDLVRLTKEETRRPKSRRLVETAKDDRDAAWELFDKMRAMG